MTEKSWKEYCDEHKLCTSGIREVKEVQDKQWDHINKIEETRPTTKALIGFVSLAVVILMAAFGGLFNQNSKNAQAISDSHKAIMAVTTDNDQKAQRKIDVLTDVVTRIDERVKNVGR